MTQGRLLGAVSALAMGFACAAHAKQFPAVPGEFVVKLKSSTNIMSTVHMEKVLGAQVKEQINKRERLVLIQRPVIETQDAVLSTLAHNPMVEYIEPNYIYRVVSGSTSLPDDPELGRLWGLINTGQRVEGDEGSILGRAGVDIGAEQAWQIETGSREVIVAVIDTGVRWDHPDLAGNIYTNEAEANGKTGEDDDGNGCVDDIHGCDIVGKDGDPMDVYGHGTHVSGTIGATANNANGIVGVAWNVRILPVRFLGDDGSGSLADAIKSIDYATAMGAHIMNNSWGGGGFSQALMDAIVRAKDAGSLFVAAAGNSANNNDSSPEYPASYEVDNVISVAAIDPNGSVASFSNYGRNSVHIAAPGVNVVSYTMRGVESWSGTSMATPHVAGVATLLLSQDMTQSYATIKERLLNSARPLGSLRGRVATGLVSAYYALTNTVAPLDPNDPYNWQKTEQEISTEHPYPANARQEWTVNVPGAKKVAVYFSRFETESGYDKVTFKDAAGNVVGTLSGNLGETYGPVVDGDTVTITFSADDSVNAHGFDVGGIAYQN
ncbi:MAG: S8 family serine peptidase [Bdellovibrionales bacterium]